MGKQWILYILECKDGTLYTGITDNLERRLMAHRAGKGAKYTRGRGPFKLRYTELCDDHSAALHREYAVKQLNRLQKLQLCHTLEEQKKREDRKMIIIIAGASHTGKTLLAQKILEAYKYPYFSIDHLKMGLIRSGNTHLTPMSSDGDLTAYLWPIVREMIKTAIENRQNLVVEGCYIPFNWADDFPVEYLQYIRYFCLVMSENYIKNHFSDIMNYACEIENRSDDDCTMERLLEDNKNNLALAKAHNVNYILIDGKYELDLEIG